MDIFEEIAAAKKSGKAFAVITVVEGSEHGTADAGKKMIHFADGTNIGTIGGGVFEFECMKQVQERLLQAPSIGLLEFAGVKLLVEAFAPVTTIVVVGGGHVGKALLKTAQLLPLATVLIDDRDASQIGESMALADTFVPCTNYEQGLLDPRVPTGAYIFCAAWNHDHDADALKGALQKSPAYVGMVGSQQKMHDIFARLRAQGVTQEALDTVYTPVGLDIADGSPEEIAFAIMAEILMIKNNGTGTNCRSIKNKFVCGNCENLE